MSNQDDILLQKLRGMQIIAGFVLLGLLVFLAGVLSIVFVQNNGAGLAPPGALPLVSLLAILFFAMQTLLAFLVPRFQIRTAVRRIASGSWRLPLGASEADFFTDESKLLVVRQTTMIVRLALLESASFFACIAYLVEAHPSALVVILAAVILMVVTFPTEGRIRAWLARQADELARLRQQ